METSALDFRLKSPPKPFLFPDEPESLDRGGVAEAVLFVDVTGSFVAFSLSTAVLDGCAVAGAGAVAVAGNLAEEGGRFAP